MAVGENADRIGRSDDAALVRMIEARLPLSILDTLREAGFEELEIARFVIPARAQRHRAEKGEPLTVEESERAIRLLRLLAKALDVFAGPDHAWRWLRTGLRVLDGRVPLDLARTEPGARLVESLLERIAWGAAA